MGDLSDEVLRRAREENYAERTRRREQMYNEERKLVSEHLIPEMNENLKEEDVTHAAQALFTSPEIEKSLSRLKVAFIQDPSHTVTFMKVEGAIHALVGHLLSQDPLYQLLAAECCCNLSLGDPKCCYKLAKFSSPYIISILQGSNYNVINVVLRTVANLNSSGERTCLLLFNQGMLTSLLRAVSISEVRENALKALLLLIKNRLCSLSEDEVHGILNAILPLFEKHDKAQWLVFLLSSLPCAVPVLLENGILENTLRLLSGCQNLHPDNIVSVTALVRVLGNLCADQEGVAACIIFDHWDITVQIIRFLLKSSEYAYLHNEVLWSLGNILNHSNAQVKEKVLLFNKDISCLFDSIPSTASR